MYSSRLGCSCANLDLIIVVIIVVIVAAISTLYWFHKILKNSCANIYSIKFTLCTFRQCLNSEQIFRNIVNLNTAWTHARNKKVVVYTTAAVWPDP